MKKRAFRVLAWFLCLALLAGLAPAAFAGDDELPIIHPVVEDGSRLAGANRYETSIKVADALKKQLGVAQFDNVVVAYGMKFADALGGSYLAIQKQAPILVVDLDRVALIQDYIKANLKPDGTVYILGGTAAVPAEMEQGLDGFAVKRLAGNNRYDTNLLILKEAGVGNKDILVCSGTGFADSLSASASGLPILLVGDELTDTQKQYLGGIGTRTYLMIGGKAAVNETVEAQCAAYGTTERIGGASRYETSTLVAEKFFKAPKTIVLTYALNFPDGLCGAPLAAAMGGPLVLVTSDRTEAAEAYSASVGVDSAVTLGGKGLVSDEAVVSITNADPDQPAESLTIWVSGATVDFTREQIAEFIRLNPEYAGYDIEIEPMGEGDAIIETENDLAGAADIYCFANDQIARLYATGALDELPGEMSEAVSAQNDAGSVAASTIGGKLFAYPMTSDNGFYLFYDKSVIQDPSTLEGILADCEAAGKEFWYEMTSGWYQPAFFFGAGCTLSYDTDEHGEFIASHVDYASEQGLGALKALIALSKSPAFRNGASLGNLPDDADPAAIVDGTWDIQNAKAVFGDNLAFAKLPTVTINGTPTQLSGFGGYKLMGVKPQTDENKLALCHKLAAYLTGGEAQLARFEAVGWCPSNSSAKASEAVQNDPALAALAAQLDYCVPQGQYPGEYWGLATELGAAVANGWYDDADDASLMRILQGFQYDCQELIKPADERTPRLPKVALVTDYGEVTDQSFNQASYEAAKDFCEDNGLAFVCIKPDDDSDEDRIAAMESAIAQGCDVIVAPGYAHAAAIAAVAPSAADVRFIALDVSEFDLSMCGMDPISHNVYACVYQEEIAGFLAGYAAVKLGYTKLGFLGGMAVPAVVRYGYGFIQGADKAACEGTDGQVVVNFAYANQFFGDADITAAMNGWYDNGTQVVFACGGGVFTSAAEAAQKAGGKVIGVDVDQAPVIDADYGKDLTLTSAMKGLGATVQAQLEAILDHQFFGGFMDTLGVCSPVPEKNYVQLAPSTQFGPGFAYADYEALMTALYDGSIQVDSDIDKDPGDYATVIAVNDLGNLK